MGVVVLALESFVPFSQLAHLGRVLPGRRHRGHHRGGRVQQAVALGPGGATRQSVSVHSNYRFCFKVSN